MGDLTSFQDADDISDWSKNAISWAVGSGLLSGKGNSILDPKGTATRAEVAQILMNYCIKAI
ncbi:S-layer homology domain-containing protein [Tyzzerella sp. An114]|uniref:S-layer homology domain-containing protein n=1 Tax=Tyzzerella sp. An114 TaxID=1965545 RepID=UPI0013027E5E|nr:S-layer homology domain-containing protein [Tyzzerella sp. An114]